MTYDNKDIERVIDSYIHKKIIRDMLKDRLIDGLTYAEIAERHGYTLRHTQRLIYRYKEIVFKYCKPLE